MSPGVVAGAGARAGARRAKEESAGAATEDVTIKEEPELNEAGWVKIEADWVKNEAGWAPPRCVQQVCDPLEPVCAKQEPRCAPDGARELEPVYTELETVCFKDEPISVQRPVRVKEEPPWQDSVWGALDWELKYELPVEPCLPPADTLNVKGTKWDCFVRLERCVVPRGAALRFERATRRRERATAGRPSARRATPTPSVSKAHEREIAMKQLSGLLIRRIDKVDNTYSCEICKKQYKSLACLTTHKLGHSKKTWSKVTRSNKITYFCEICKAVFHDLDSLKVHALIHAKMAIPLYLCDICHREFATNHALRTHKRTHELARPFKCQFCIERFLRSTDLSRHLATHRELRQMGKRTKLCKGCETRQALRQLGGLLRAEPARGQASGQASDNTHFCELCHN